MTALLAADPVTGLANMLGQPFVRHALLAGTAISVLSGLAGYFVVLRGQVFAGDALSHVAYAGALAALAAGLDLRLGLFAATVGVGVLLGLLGGRGVGDDVLIGTTFAWVLGLGVLFLFLYTAGGSSGDATANVNVLFGSIFGLSAPAAATATWIAAGLVAVLLLIARPLLFASIDPAVAAARGVPVRLLGPLFLAILGGTVGEASQAVGALLVFGLLAAPAAAARRLTADPWRALALAVALAVLAMWAGLVLAYAVPALPPSFTIVALAAAEFALAAGYSVLRRPISA
ncbi:metal ABC transporter permease [Jatrophihabitans sp.]|uniref:metal ABC transporter permease n=1 Tax=Jatrophihabitans sp. TaxID=1932789 RepID=UPI002CB970FC|nr:metal ABC transporter permease [Jatrophihabitans sp.]